MKAYIMIKIRAGDVKEVVGILNTVTNCGFKTGWLRV